MSEPVQNQHRIQNPHVTKTHPVNILDMIPQIVSLVLAALTEIQIKVYIYIFFFQSAAMESLLKKGLNFSILPRKQEMTQVLTDFKKFERSVIWHEFWHWRDMEQTEIEHHHFKETKY